MINPGSCPWPRSSSLTVRPVTVEWEESLGLEISISSEHISLSLLPLGYGWHEAGPESDWQCVLAAETQAPHGWGLST